MILMTTFLNQSTFIFSTQLNSLLLCINNNSGARGAMIIVAGYGHGDSSSNPGPD